MLPFKKSRIYYLVHTNQIPYQHIGRTLIFDYDEIASWSVVRGRKGRMGQDIAYLVKRNGVYAAKFQKPSGSWTHHSLHTERAAEAKLLFEQFRFDLLQKSWTSTGWFRFAWVNSLCFIWPMWSRTRHAVG